MGQYLQTSGAAISKNEEARNLVNSLRNKLTIEMLFECFKFYMQDVYPREDMSWEEFDQIFSPALNNCQPLFKALSENGAANIYEVFITSAIFSKNVEYEDKLLCIFKAFDIDGGGTLDRRELSKFIMCTINGICKIL